MLVLTRRMDERIVIGDDIIVTVVRIKDGKVRLGIQAPNEVAVHRKEVYDKISEAEHAHEPRFCCVSS